jgi:hypothetical protein
VDLQNTRYWGNTKERYYLISLVTDGKMMMMMMMMITKTEFVGYEGVE